MTDDYIERLAKVMKWDWDFDWAARPDPSGPGGYLVMVEGGTLTDSGWKALVLWLGARELEGKCQMSPEALHFWDRPGGPEDPEPVAAMLPFAAPGKPTDDELIRAVLEVAG